MYGISILRNFSDVIFKLYHGAGKIDDPSFPDIDPLTQKPRMECSTLPDRCKCGCTRGVDCGDKEPCRMQPVMYEPKMIDEDIGVFSDQVGDAIWCPPGKVDDNGFYSPDGSIHEEVLTQFDTPELQSCRMFNFQFSQYHL